MSAREHRSPAVPRLSASLIVLRDSERGLQVLMLRRAERAGDQHSGVAVFPGGVVDQNDRELHSRCVGLDDAAASARLGVTGGGLDFWVAAVRECFEEAGLLFGIDPQGAWVDLDTLGASERMALRHALHAGRTDLNALCERFQLRLPADRLHYFSHWLTPPGRPKRFDTRFLLAQAPPGQIAIADDTETADLMWLTPAEALSPDQGLTLLTVTEETLKVLVRFSSVQQAIAHAEAVRDVALIMPRIGSGASGERQVLPGEWAYAEIGRLDPLGHGDVGFELRPGHAVRLSSRVVRVTANNGSMMTGPGTNSYFVAEPGGGPCALIDPGPDDAAHVRALLAAAPGPITRIIVTHTHKDHSPAAQAVRAATGAALFGRVADHPEWQDHRFMPDTVLAHGERVVLGADTALRVIHTPGHASNHLCYLLEQEKMLFTGDHLMQGSTVVINPPDGDMRAYLEALKQLLDEDIEWLAPGHGFLMDSPHDVARKVIAHRLQREAKVVDALERLGHGASEALLAEVYRDVPARLHGMAARSLQAHLLKLRADGRASEQDGVWAMTQRAP